MSLVHRAQRVCVVTYLASLALQFYAAGLAIFGATSFVPHALLGYGLVIGALTVTILTLAARFPVRIVALAAALIPLTVLQPVFALTLRPTPPVAALHAFNAIVIFSLAVYVAARTKPQRATA